jgi:Tfp pilus assembly protein PilV
MSRITSTLPLAAARRGVALIEALVALAVIGFGMLAVVGSIGTLRLNGDVARQRSEALRIAQDRIEEWRGFSVLDTTADRTAYEDIGDVGAFDVVAANTTFSVSIEVNEDSDVAGTRRPARKHVLVLVRWKDRVDQDQEVRLTTTVAGIDPALRAAGVRRLPAAPARALGAPPRCRPAHATSATGRACSCHRARPPGRPAWFWCSTTSTG